MVRLRRECGGAADVSSSPSGLSCYRRVIGKCGNHLSWKRSPPPASQAYQCKCFRPKNTFSTKSHGFPVWEILRGRIWAKSVEQTSSNAIFPLDPLFQTSQRRKRVVEGDTSGEGEGGELGGGTATDAIDLHDPVRNGWEAS